MFKSGCELVFLLYCSATQVRHLHFFDGILKASLSIIKPLSIFVQLYIVIIGMYSICFGINIAYPSQLLRSVKNMGRR